MVRWISELTTSWRLDSGASPSAREESASRIARVDRLLADRAGQPVHAAPAGLNRRIVEALAVIESADNAPARQNIQTWQLAAAACLLIAGGVAVRYSLVRAVPVAAPESVAVLNIPVGPQPMLRLVAGSFNQPLRDEAARMMSDTRRATRAMARCVPFTRWEN